MTAPGGVARSGRLPAGRHGLPRSEVSRSQRERLLRAMTEAVAERGYAHTPVAEVIRRAGVSRETFYEHFAGKHGCFVAAYEAAAATLLGATTGGDERGPGGESVLDRLDGMLARYLAVLEEHPAAARTFLVEVYAAGPEVLARREVVQEGFTAEVIRAVGARTERERFACEALVAAVSTMVTQRVATGRFDELGTLRTPLRDVVADMLAARGLAE